MALRTPRPVQLLDIRSDRDEASLRQLVLQGLCTASLESRKLPTLILYDGNLIRWPSPVWLTSSRTRAEAL